MAETKLSLEEKLVEIRKGAAYVQKTKAGYGYKFAPEDEILAKVTPLQNKYKVLLFKRIVPGTFSVEPNIYQKIESKPDKTGAVITTEKTVSEYLCKAELIFTFVDAEDPKQQIEVPWAMVAVQTDATFSYAGAFTSALRLFWMKQLDMATSEYGQDEYVAKQKEAEEQENKKIVAEIVEQINKIYAPYADDKEKKAAFVAELKKVLIIDGKPSVNWTLIKDPVIASQVLALAKKVFNIVEKGDKK